MYFGIFFMCLRLNRKLYAYTVDPDLTPPEAVSDLCLHCMCLSFFYKTLGINRSKSCMQIF